MVLSERWSSESDLDVQVHTCIRELIVSVHVTARYTVVSAAAEFGVCGGGVDGQGPSFRGETVTVLEAVQSLSRDIAGVTRREREEERGWDPT